MRLQSHVHGWPDIVQGTEIVGGVLDQWLAERVPGLRSSADVRSWQVEALNRTISHAVENGPFYSRHLKGGEQEIREPADLAQLPMTTPEDLREASEDFLCISQDEVARVMTLESSGTTGSPKRIFYTAGDLERTTGFFSWGMRNMARSGDTVLVLLPGTRSGGVSRLLCEAVERFGAYGVAYGPADDPAHVAQIIKSENVACIVGAPAHLNVLAAWWRANEMGRSPVRSVLLCWDSIPQSVVTNVGKVFGCHVFRHWGMVETGLGGAVDCCPGSGLHLRAPDMFVEVVDPQTGTPRAAGEFGEVVVTTLSRRAMPLVRYRTGDLGRLVHGRCVCDGRLPRMEITGERIGSGIQVGEHGSFGLCDLNEALYELPELADFSARWYRGDIPVLHLAVSPAPGSGVARSRVEKALLGIDTIKKAVHAGDMNFEISPGPDAGPAEPGLGKRRLLII